MKKLLILCFAMISAGSISLAQTCMVNVDSLQGEYNGDCRKGKAEGMGTARGIDFYRGNFKNGYPDGEGKYIWKNGTWYEGFWKNGLFQGRGTLNKVNNDKPDSGLVLKGFWEKGKYIGSYEKPYILQPLTNAINDLSIRKLNSVNPDITITVKNTTGGASTLSNSVLPNSRLIDIQLIEGRFEQKIADETSSRITSKYVLHKVTFPFFAILSFETMGAAGPQVEKVSLEIFENANWYVQVNIDD